MLRISLRDFSHDDYAGGVVLLLSTFVAMILANSSFSSAYQHLTHFFLFWINDVLMALFFLIVGLELRRGIFEKEFSSVSQIALPAFAALGGMLVPALIYLALTHDHPIAIKGWPTPVATDIAIAVAVYCLVGQKFPQALKLFLLALAIFDDIGAILIITFFSMHGSWLGLIASLLLTIILYVMNRLTIDHLFFYLIVGCGLWLSFYYAGIHPTIAGVLLALFIPNHEDDTRSLNYQLEKILKPWVMFLIMPLFALANAGFSLSLLSWDILKSQVVLGIVSGLFLGKQLGIFGFSWLIIQLHRSSIPKGVTWNMLYGVSILCGIGFTMSLFLGTLSFQNQDPVYLTEMRLGVLFGTILSATIGAFVLFLISKCNSQEKYL